MSNIVGPVFAPRGGTEIIFPWFIADMASMTFFTIQGFPADGLNTLFHSSPPSGMQGRS